MHITPNMFKNIQIISFLVIASPNIMNPKIAQKVGFISVTTTKSARSKCFTPSKNSKKPIHPPPHLQNKPKAFLKAFPFNFSVLTFFNDT